MIKRNKGQQAMEYLMSYGWAIVIIIVVVFVLFEMGVFDLPEGSLGCMKLQEKLGGSDFHFSDRCIIYFCDTVYNIDNYTFTESNCRSEVYNVVIE